MELRGPIWNPEIQDRRTLFLHGMGGTGALWRPIAIGLEGFAQVFAPDQRGHGLSRVPHVPGARTQPSYYPLDYGRDLAETLEKKAYHPTWVIGHSMGVRSACALAHLRPDYVRGLCLVDLGFSGVAGGGLGEGLASFVRKLPQRFNSRAEARAFMDAECPDPSIAQYLMAVSMPEPPPPVGAGGLTFPFDHSALIATIQAARDSSVRAWVEALASRGLPVLVLRGAVSGVWSHEELEQERAHFAAYPSVVFEEFEGAGHGLPFEKRPQFVQRVKDWILANE